MILFSAFLCFMVPEIFLRIFRAKPMQIFPRYVTAAHYQDFAIRTNIPHANYRHQSYDGVWHYQINSQGFRANQDYSYSKPANTLRVLSLGDSFTMGFEVQQQETFSEVLEKKLQAKGIPAQVINAGVSGFSTAEELVFLEQEGLKYHPDVVVLGFFENDLLDNLRADLYRLKEGELFLNKKEYLPAIGIRDFLYPCPLYRWLSEYSYFFNELNIFATVFAKKNIEEKNLQQIAGLHQGDELPAYEARLAKALLEKIHRITKEHHILFILIDIPNPQGQASLPNSISGKDVSDIFIDGRKMLKSYQDRGDLYLPHGQNHWSKISHEAAGTVLADWIEKEHSSANA